MYSDFIHCIVSIYTVSVYCIPGVANLWPAFKKIMAFFKSEGAKKRVTKKIWEDWQKSTS